MRTRRWKAHIIVAALVTGLVVTVWSGPGFSQARRGGLITFALYQEPELLNPFIATQTASFEVLQFAVEGLLGVNENGEYYAVLAKAVPSRQNGGVSADGKTITYQLKDDLKWSDGRAMTCGDVQFTLQAIMNPRSGAVSTAGYRDIEAVECPNAATVLVKYRAFYAPYLALFDYVMPRHATGDPAEMPRWPYNRKVVGTGPFTMLEWQSGDHITFIPNRYYREAGKPYLNSVIIRIVPSREVGKQLIRTGEVDVVWDLVEADVPEVRAYPGVKVSAAPGADAERLVFNLADPSIDGPPPEVVASRPHPILGDARVREAIELGINKKEIIDKLLFGLAPVGTNELHIGWAKCVTRASEYTPDRARQLLDQAGWRPGSDGIRLSQGVRTTRDGTRLRLKYQTTTGNRLREQVQQLMIDYMKQVGVEFFIENVPSPVLFGSWASGAFRRHGQFDVLMYTTGPNLDPQSQVEGYFASWYMPNTGNGGAGFNYSRWSNKVFDENTKLAGSSPDINVRKRAYCAAMNELVKDRPHIYLYARSQIHGYRERLQGWVANVWARLGWNSADWSAR